MHSKYQTRKLSHLLFGRLSYASSRPLPSPIKSLSTNDSQCFHLIRYYTVSTFEAASQVTRKSSSFNDKTRYEKKTTLLLLLLLLLCIFTCGLLLYFLLRSVALFLSLSLALRVYQNINNE